MNDPTINGNDTDPRSWAPRLEEARDVGYQEGFNRGYDEGYSVGYLDGTDDALAEAA